MIRGLLTGLVLGAAVAAAGLSAVSLLVLPPPVGSAPVGMAEPAPAVDPAPAVPAPEMTPATPDAVPAPATPDAAPPAAGPATATSDAAPPAAAPAPATPDTAPTAVAPAPAPPQAAGETAASPGGEPDSAAAGATRPAQTVPAPAPLAQPAPAAEQVPLVEPPRADPDPRPPVPQAGVVEVPAGSQFGRGRDDAQPTAPAPPEPAPDLAAAAPVPQPAGDPTPAPPEVEPAAAPDVAALPGAPDAPSAIAPAPAAPAAEAPVTAPGVAPAPAAPAVPAAPVVAEGAPAAPAAAPDALAPAPEVATFATVPTAPEAEPLPIPAAGPAETPEPAQAPRSLPQIDPAAQGEAAPDPAAADPGRPPEVAGLAPAMPTVPDAPQPGFALAEGVRMNRLPQLGVSPEPQAAEAPDAPDAAAREPTGALSRYRADFAAPEGTALMGILLIPPPAGDEAAPGALPASVALDPRDAGAPARMTALRAEGREIAILAAGLPDGARPRDLEVNFAAWAAALPEAALIADTPVAAVQNDRMLATQLVTIAAAGGFGLVTHDIGLNSAGQRAAGAGLPHAESFAILGGEGAAALRRTLDRAGFEAGRSGRVLVVAEARPEVLETLVAWLATRPDIAAAPASAVLTGR